MSEYPYEWFVDCVWLCVSFWPGVPRKAPRPPALPPPPGPFRRRWLQWRVWWAKCWR